MIRGAVDLPPPAGHRRWFLVLPLLLFLALGAAAPPPSAPTVGMEGRLEVNLAGSALEAKPVEPRAKILLRIADTRPHGTLTAYDLRYVGMEPGRYDLRDYLVRRDGSSLADLPPLTVEVAPLLPKEHDGLLSRTPPAHIPILGGYRGFLIAAGLLWLLCLVPILLARRRRRAAAPAGPAAAPLTLADRLRPLVERAAEGRLETDGQAQLERLLLTHWRRRLHLEEVDMPEAIARLRQDAEAGQLLRQLEDWLHRPPGAATVDVNVLLEPYRTAAEPAP